MKPQRLTLVFVITAGLCFGQQFDKAFYGRWNLNVAKSKYGDNNIPKAGSVVISPEGWVSASYYENGFLNAVAIATKNGVGCTPIGFPQDFSCEVKVVDGRHVTSALKQGTKVVAELEAELHDDNTIGLKETWATDKGPVVDHTILEKAKPPAKK
jgi:hypothetical protein